MAIAGWALGDSLKVVTAAGVCSRITVYPHPDSWTGPASLAWIGDAVAGCGSPYSTTSRDSERCYTFSMAAGWTRIQSPHMFPNNPNLNGALVNSNGTLYYLDGYIDPESGEPYTALQEYSPAEDEWKNIAHLPRNTLNINCVVDLGDGEIFAQFLGDNLLMDNFKFSLGSRKWVQLPASLHRDTYGGSCVRVQLSTNLSKVFTVPRDCPCLIRPS